MPTFLPSDLILNGHVKPLEGMHDGIQFEYKPAGFSDAKLLIGQYNKLEGVELEKLVTGELTQRVKSWNVVHPESGETVPITTENINRLHHLVVIQMFDIMLQLAPSDPLPEQGE